MVELRINSSRLLSEATPQASFNGSFLVEGINSTLDELRSNASSLSATVSNLGEGFSTTISSTLQATLGTDINGTFGNDTSSGSGSNFSENSNSSLSNIISKVLLSSNYNETAGNATNVTEEGSNKAGLYILLFASFLCILAWGYLLLTEICCEKKKKDPEEEALERMLKMLNEDIEQENDESNERKGRSRYREVFSDDSDSDGNNDVDNSENNDGSSKNSDGDILETIF